MPKNFTDYQYYPALRSRLWEMRGHTELDKETKSKIIPIIALAKYQKTTTAAAVIETVAKLLDGGPFILDVEPSVYYRCDDAQTLYDPDQDYGAWRKHVASIPNVIPSVLVRASGGKRPIIQQALKLEQSFGQIAIRSRNPSSDLEVLSNVLSSIDDAKNLLVILDYQYVRGASSELADKATNLIAGLREVNNDAVIALIGSSYPQAAASYGDAGATLEIYERSFHASVASTTDVIYGDYASIHPIAFAPQKSLYVPRIDYPTATTWTFRRYRDDDGGWKKCAQEITDLPQWDKALVEQSWGAQKIAAAKAGDLTGMGAPGPWIAARVNMHILRQLDFDPGIPNDEDQDE
ncbi:MAG: beta family protein [Methyloceanibacter sp.]|uniref:beta family protein n=1 Tax=Methyloceanibacter sp. TaxID=1965321 RepID=UPI003D6D19D7